MRFDVSEIVGGNAAPNYAHEYDGYMAFFAMLAHAHKSMQCTNVPLCWTPFILYLGHTVASEKKAVWDHEGLDWRRAYKASDDKRRVVEVASVARPELAHALYLADTLWPCPLVRGEHKGAFVVTCNGSFFRSEVIAYRKALAEFVPKKRNVVIVPCSAEKPYPSALHREVARVLRGRDDWYVMIATGVLGLVPDLLWPIMPLYDSGIPYITRVEQEVCRYFSAHEHDNVVVFSDFYAHAVSNGLKRVRRIVHAHFVFGDHYRDTYENLMLPEHLAALSNAVEACSP